MSTEATSAPRFSPTGWIADPVSAIFRRSRMLAFEKAFAPDGNTRIIDVGGTERNWHMMAAEPQVLLVNITGESYERGRFSARPGDGTALQYPDNSFDIAYSNSVIEHLHTVENQKKFAAEIRRLAPSYYVQTPYKWFPVEPHMISLFIHWLPRPIYRRLIGWFSVWGWSGRPSQAEIDAKLDEVKLLTEKELRSLFPDGVIVRERFLGLTKSLIVMRIADKA